MTLGNKGKNFTKIIIIIGLTSALISQGNNTYATANEKNVTDQKISLDFNFAAVGDFGCTENTKVTIESIIDGEAELVLGLGDYGYRDTAECFLKLVDPIDHKMKITIGNHEHSYYPGDGTFHAVPSLLEEYMTHFNLTKQFYSFNYRNVHFISISTETAFDIASEQYDFLVKDLIKATSDPNIDWIIVFFHRLAYTTPSYLQSIAKVRDTFHPLFEKYNADLIIQAHSHNYQRSFPINYNNQTSSVPIITDLNHTNYHDPKGQIFTIVGTGGASHVHNFTGTSNFTAVQFNAYGYLNVEFLDNGTRMVGTFRNNNENISDTFMINKNIADKN